MRTGYFELGAGTEFFVFLFQLPVVIIILTHMVGGVAYSVAMTASIAGLELATGILGWYYDGPMTLKLLWRCFPFLAFVNYFALAIELS